MVSLQDALSHLPGPVSIPDPGMASCSYSAGKGDGACYPGASSNGLVDLGQSAAALLKGYHASKPPGDLYNVRSGAGAGPGALH